MQVWRTIDHEFYLSSILYCYSHMTLCWPCCFFDCYLWTDAMSTVFLVLQYLRHMSWWVSHHSTAVQTHDGIYLTLLKSVELTLCDQWVCGCCLSCCQFSDQRLSLLFSNVCTLQLVSLKKCGKVWVACYSWQPELHSWWVSIEQHTGKSF